MLCFSAHKHETHAAEGCLLCIFQRACKCYLSFQRSLIKLLKCLISHDSNGRRSHTEGILFGIGTVKGDHTRVRNLFHKFHRLNGLVRITEYLIIILIHQVLNTVLLYKNGHIMLHGGS